MTIPAEAFAFTTWSEVKAGQLARINEDWVLAIDVSGSSGRLGCIVLSGKYMGNVEDFARNNPRVLTLAAGYSWRAVVGELPPGKPAEGKRGALMIGPHGPFLKSFHGQDDDEGYVLGLDGKVLHLEAHVHLIVEAWAVHLVSPSGEKAWELFSVDTHTYAAPHMIIG